MEYNHEAEMSECDKKKDMNNALACKFDKLYKITEFQDLINLNIMKTLDDDTDERWLSIHMVDNANAIILGIARGKGRPKQILRDMYVSEKIDALNDKWAHIKLTHGNE